MKYFPFHFNLSTRPKGADNAGRITQKVENIGVDIVTWDYTYDAMGRLETVYKDNSLAEAYSYDGHGNRLSEVNNLRSVSRSYTHSVEDHTLTAGADTYTYDVDGFLTSRTIASGAYSETATFDYSSRGELLSITLPDATVISYEHDPMGRRLSKSLNGVVVEKYLWQDATTLLAVYDASDNLIQRFEYADGRMPVSMVYNSSVYYLTYDQVGSLKVVTDTAGTIVKRIDYDSFGNILSENNPAISVLFGFAGGLHDQNTGLVRFGARDYDPMIGKWTAKDPTDFTGGDLNLGSYVDIVGKPSVQTNLYLYTDADPINLVDPLGLAPLPGYEEFWWNPGNFKFYGNWGGPGWTGGFEGSWDQLSWDQRRNASCPVDKMDKLFKQHDIAYGLAREEYNLYSNTSRYDRYLARNRMVAKFRIADRTLAEDLLSLKSPPSSEWKRYMAAWYFDKMGY